MSCSVALCNCLTKTIRYGHCYFYVHVSTSKFHSQYKHMYDTGLSLFFSSLPTFSPYITPALPPPMYKCPNLVVFSGFVLLFSRLPCVCDGVLLHFAFSYDCDRGTVHVKNHRVTPMNSVIGQSGFNHISQKIEHVALPQESTWETNRVLPLSGKKVKLIQTWPIQILRLFQRKASIFLSM